MEKNKFVTAHLPNSKFGELLEDVFFELNLNHIFEKYGTVENVKSFVQINLNGSSIYADIIMWVSEHSLEIAVNYSSEVYVYVLNDLAKGEIREQIGQLLTCYIVEYREISYGSKVTMYLFNEQMELIKKFPTQQTGLLFGFGPSKAEIKLCLPWLRAVV